MSTPRVFVRRLRKLANYLETKVRPAVETGKVQWDMQRWAHGARPTKELNCGTAACAAGFATTLFRPLTLDSVDPRDRGDQYVLRYTEGGRNFYGFEATGAFFGTNEPFDYELNESKRPSMKTVIRKLRSEADRIEQSITKVRT